jgi:hypothetical protein
MTNLTFDVQKAQAAKMAKIEAGKAQFKTDFMDSPIWDDLAKEYGIRLPNWWQPPEVRMMRRYLRRLNIKERDYCLACGEGYTLDKFASNNPTFPLRAFVGNLLEYHDEINNAKAVLNRIR